MARLRLEVHIGAVKQAFVRDGVDPALFEPERVDDLRKQIADMAEVLSDWWEYRTPDEMQSALREGNTTNG